MEPTPSPNPRPSYSVAAACGVVISATSRDGTTFSTNSPRQKVLTARPVEMREPAAHGIGHDPRHETHPLLDRPGVRVSDRHGCHILRTGEVGVGKSERSTDRAL